MSRAIRPEDAFELELSGATSPQVASDLMGTVELLRAAGHGIQAPTSLYGRRNVLLQMTANAGLRSRPGDWRRSRALLLAAAVTALTAVGVSAATIGSGWLAETNPPVTPGALPSLEDRDDTMLRQSPSPSPAVIDDDEPRERDIVEPRASAADATDDEEGDDTDSHGGDDSDDDEPEFDESDTDEFDPGEPDSEESHEPDGDESESDEPDASEDDADEAESDEPDGDEPDTGDPDTGDPDTDEPDSDDSDELDATDADGGTVIGD